jgi:glycerophosphoryl diester phosphodiesterase
MKTYILPDGSPIVIHDETLHRGRKTIDFTLNGGQIVIAVEKEVFELARLHPIDPRD